MGRYVGTLELYAYVFGTSGTIVQGGGTITADQQSLLGSAINDAESAIDTYTRRDFVGQAGTRYFNRYQQDRVRSQALYLEEDLHTLVSLTNGDTTPIPTGSVWLEPRNEPPYRIMRLKSQYVWVWNTDSDVTVAGTWGYSTVVPADIHRAAVQLSAYFYRLKDVGATTDVAGFPEAGEVQITSGIPNSIRHLLNPYRSRSGGAV